MSSERRLAAILSADVAGYSRLMAEDEQGTIQTLTAYREAIRTLVEQHHGRVVDSPGDNLLAEFPNALDAVQCAVEIQRVLQVRNQSLAENRRMLFRIGVHLGDIAGSTSLPWVASVARAVADHIGVDCGLRRSVGIGRVYSGWLRLVNPSAESTMARQIRWAARSVASRCASSSVP